MKKQKQIEFSAMLAELKPLSVEELLYLYIEAKTGNYEDSNSFMDQEYDIIYHLVDRLNYHYEDKNLGAPFLASHES